MSSRLENKFLTWGFLVIGVCLLAIAVTGSNRMFSVIDAVLGIASVTIGVFRARRNRKGVRISF
jgi:uncharacterized membrane protein (DUF441 family)